MKDVVREILQATLERYNSESGTLMKQIGEAEQFLADLRAKHAELEETVLVLSKELKERA